MSDVVLAVKNLSKSYKRGALQARVDAVKNVSFEVRAGQITGFLGANGAGKTTSIKCILELARADKGEIFYFGEKGLSSSAKEKIGFLPERPYFYEYLTGREFLRFYGQLAKMKTSNINQQIPLLLEKVGLTQAADRPLRGYSKGMLQRVGIAQALIHRPQLIILDEPVTGLDPDGRFEIREIILAAARAGTAVFFSSHLLPDAESLCDRLVILKKGNLIYDGATAELLQKHTSGYEVSFQSAAGVRSEIVRDEQELQSLIDRLRSSNNVITEVKPNRSSLEKVFMEIAFDKKSNASEVQP